MSRKEKSAMPIALLVVGVLVFLSWGSMRIYQDIRYEQDIGGHLKRAADANQPALSIQELEIAEKNMDAWDLCPSPEDATCYTSIIYRTPDEDLGFWRTNISQTKGDLEAIPPDADHLIISNTLLKVRETLLDNEGQSGVNVTDPSGIHLYPHNTFYMMWSLLGTLLTLGGGIWLFVDHARHH